MILDNAPTKPAVLSDGMETYTFSIDDDSGKIYQILSSGIYSDPIRAVIRELGCNAYDAHVDVGRADLPFDVHLPTTMEPYFAVRDYGTGLSEEGVTRLYTRYGESTKSKSDLYVGALGLGSKSPFACTQNFTVISRHQGMKHVYTAYIGDTGVPSLAAMSSEPSDEPSGLEVKFSVNKTAEYSTYVSKAGVVFEWFATKPNVNVELRYAPHVYRTLVFEDAGLMVGERGRGSRVVMGGVAYPVTKEDLDRANCIRVGIGPDEYDTLIDLLDMAVTIKAPIGSIDFAVSREQPRFTAKTINYIFSRLQDIFKLLYPKFHEDVRLQGGIDDVWQHSKRLYEEDRRYRSLGSVSFLKRYHEDYKDDLYDVEDIVNGHIHLFDVSGLTVYHWERDYGGYKKAKLSDAPNGRKGYEVKFSGEYEFVLLEGKERLTKARLDHSGRAKNIIVILSTDDRKIQTEAFLAPLRGSGVMKKLSDYPAIKYGTSEKRLTKGNFLTLTDKHENYSIKTVWKTLDSSVVEAMMQAEQDVLYVPVSGFYYCEEGGKPVEKFDLKELARHSGSYRNLAKDSQIVFVRKEGLKIIPDHWVSLRDYMEEQLRDLTIEDSLSLYYPLMHLKRIDDVIRYTKNVEGVALLDFLRDMKERHDKWESLLRVAKYLDGLTNYEAEKKKAEHLYQKYLDENIIFYMMNTDNLCYGNGEKFMKALVELDKLKNGK